MVHVAGWDLYCCTLSAQPLTTAGEELLIDDISVDRAETVEEPGTASSDLPFITLLLLRK